MKRDHLSNDIDSYTKADPGRINDANAALAKYARSQPNDLRWIRAGILCGLVSLPKIKNRLASTTFLDGDEESRVRKQVDATLAWFEILKSSRNPSLDPPEI